MFQTFLTGLREALEAALIVGILVAYLQRSGRQHLLRPLWIGVAAAIALSTVAYVALSISAGWLDDEIEEAFAGITSVVAVGLVTWMVFWMRTQARHMTAELHGRLDRAAALGAGAVALTGFLAVGREGLETALFLSANEDAVGSGVAPRLTALAGIALAVVLGYLIYRRAVAINLARFFRITGAALVVIAAGVLAYGVHELQEVGVLPGEDSLAWNLTGFSRDSWYGTLLEGTINFRPKMSILEIVAYLGYLVPVMALFLRPTSSRTSTTTPAPAPAEAVR
ncbi:MAG: iron uptake transporter permease EfeU [Ilumatobacteraceae bacterium]